ncbi:ribonuclease P protein component [Trichocoleus sp. FACHB-262]|uniref:Ribonuclease P protein component n=1 Tax=Trichocoleus desertorum GB2-A4 TaxID=2933944 RepID=A0ABV0JAH4_9CYAN|nr:ribonuclease P protein component [Trichocoleus sp. FACHB-262]MBD1861488.1 ribonuclease P protein component [Trichocoleus sp. FACHB-46]MBD2122150.1 ribonuclease P protein component [Trichocoleus sp. FACHB-262]
MSLPQSNRLKRRQDFSAVYQGGIRRSTANITLRALNKQGHLNHSSHSPALPTQIGISVSQKVSKRAVVRNRLKRQIRAALRQFLPQLPLGWQLVVVVRPPAVQCDYHQVLRELEQLLVDAEVLR